MNEYQTTKEVINLLNNYRSLKDIVVQLEKSEYECEGGYLKNNLAFIKLKELADMITVKQIK